MGGLLKQQGVELSLLKNKESFWQKFPIEEGRGKKADPQPAGYHKKCEESGKRWVLVYSVEKPPVAAGGRFLLKNSNEDTKNVSDIERRKWKWRRKGAECSPGRGPTVAPTGNCRRRNYFTRLLPFPVTFAIWFMQKRNYLIGCYAEEHLWRYWHKRG